MNFNIYDIASSPDGDVQELSENAEPVESGLSGGELRQSLLDRFRSALRRGDLDAVSTTVEEYFGLVVQEDDSDQILHDIDELLYLAEDEDLLGDWDFGSGKIVSVAEE